MGKKFFNCGNAGNGQVIKLCNNIALAMHMVSICEALNMAQRLGMDPSEASKIMCVATARCHSIDTYNPIPGYLPNSAASRNYDGGFGVDLMLKDAKLAVEAAKHVGAKTDLGAHSVDFYERASKAGAGKKDFSVLYDLLQKNVL